MDYCSFYIDLLQLIRRRQAEVRKEFWNPLPRTSVGKNRIRSVVKHPENQLGRTFQQLDAPATIRVGQTAYVPVYANRLWNDSGIDVVSGQAFSFSVPGGEEWIDWQKECGAEGYASTYFIRPWKMLRRVPKANGLQLVATIGKSIKSPIIIGSKLLNFLPPFPGRLYLFANDLPWMYWNNRGMIAVRITRTK